MTLKIMIEMAPPPAAPKKKPSEDKSSVEEKVRYALDCIESGHKSEQEWLLVNKLYKNICQHKKPNQRMQNIKDMIEPVLKKYGYHGTSTEGSTGE
jgi:hypothetical protein